MADMGPIKTAPSPLRRRIAHGKIQASAAAGCLCLPLPRRLPLSFAAAVVMNQAQAMQLQSKAVWCYREIAVPLPRMRV